VRARASGGSLGTFWAQLRRPEAVLGERRRRRKRFKNARRISIYGRLRYSATFGDLFLESHLKTVRATRPVLSHTVDAPWS
jgi:hypothetical protein